MSTDIAARGRWVRRGMIWHFIGERPAEEPDKPKHKRRARKTFCIDCGVLISHGAQRCLRHHQAAGDVQSQVTLADRLARNFAANPTPSIWRVCDDCYCLTHDQEDCPGCLAAARQHDHHERKAA